MYCLIVLPFSLQFLTNAENLISNWSVMPKPKLMIPTDGVIWTGLVWLRIETSWELLFYALTAFPASSYYTKWEKCLGRGISPHHPISRGSALRKAFAFMHNKLNIEWAQGNIHALIGFGITAPVFEGERQLMSCTARPLWSVFQI
jgi:hypothetical protein